MNALAIGDSWFSERFGQSIGTGGGLIRALRPLRPDITWDNQAIAGATTVEMLGCDRYDRMVSSLKTADIMLVSSGGDSICGDWLREFIRNRVDVDGRTADALDKDTIGAMFQLIAALYNDILDTRDKVNPSCRVYAINYGLPFCDGRGVDILWGAWTVAGPWLQPSMIDCGWTEPVEQQAIMSQIMDGFNRTLLEIQARRIRFTVLNTQSLSIPISGWKNELHPTQECWETVVAPFVSQALRI